MRTRIGAVACLLALAAVALLVSGCGATLDPVAQAATRTAEAPTLRFSLDVAATLPTRSAPVHVAVTGTIDGAGARAEMTMDLSRLAAAGGPPGLGRVRTLLDGSSMYIAAPFLGRLLPAGKTWARIDLDRVGKALGGDISTFTSGQADPRTTLAQLREAGNVVKVGSTVVDGVPATRYSVLLDTKAGLDRLHGALRRQAESALDRLEAAGRRYVPATAWVDGSGYLRRFRVAMPDYFGAGTGFALTMRLFDFGADVAIAVPPAAEVADLTDRLPS